MSEITNESSIKDDEMVNQVRNAIEHRATWMGLMSREAKKAGADWEAIARKAVRCTGCIHGKRIAKKMAVEEGMESFAKHFVPELTQRLFEMDIKELSDTELRIEFNYCPLVNAWQKLNISEDIIRTLCDIAMDGDRGIAEELGLEFELGSTIAKGGKTCEVRFQTR